MANDQKQTREKVLTAVLDRLVPPIDELPGAGGLELAPRVMEVAERIARFGEALREVEAGLAAAPDDRDFSALDAEQQTATLRAVEEDRPAAFETLVKLTYLVYYGDDWVRRRIGWKPGGVQPDGFELPPFEESVLDTIRKRTPFWRQTE